jgi:predicted Fe-Mo cluster-binding NifX family protein
MMKIAVPTRDGRVDDHFGHCAYYTVFTVVDGKIVSEDKLASPEGCGCKSGIAPVLRQTGVAVMLAGNMGQGAKNVLEAQRIEVLRGCSGDVRELAEAYLAGKLHDNGEACAHHDCH